MEGARRRIAVRRRGRWVEEIGSSSSSFYGSVDGNKKSYLGRFLKHWHKGTARDRQSKKYIWLLPPASLSACREIFGAKSKQRRRK